MGRKVGVREGGREKERRGKRQREREIVKGSDNREWLKSRRAETLS